MRTLLWITVLLLLSAAAALAFHLVRSRPHGSLVPNLNLADRTAIVSLLLNAALFVVTIVSLLIAVAAFQSAEKSSSQQLQTLEQSRNALRTTADTLEASATHFRESAEAAKGQFDFLQAEKRDREKAVLAALIRELTTNETALAENKIALESELEALKQGKSLIGPLSDIHSDAWDLLRIYLPHEIGGNSMVLTRVTETYALTQRTKEVIRSREEYRLHNQAMDNFSHRMTVYDEQMLALNGRLAEHIKALLGSLPRIKPD